MYGNMSLYMIEPTQKQTEVIAKPKKDIPDLLIASEPILIVKNYCSYDQYEEDKQN